MVEIKTNIERLDTLSIDYSEQLAAYDFMAISKNCLINPAYIRRIDTQSVELNGCTLDISRLKKKSFLLQFSDWLAKGGRSV